MHRIYSLVGSPSQSSLVSNVSGAVLQKKRERERNVLELLPVLFATCLQLIHHSLCRSVHVLDTFKSFVYSIV